MKLKNFLILTIGIFLIGPLCVFSQEKNISASLIASDGGAVMRGWGFKVLIGPDVKFEKKVGPDFDVYHFSYKGEHFLGAYSGNHPSFGGKVSETLVRATEKWTYVSARCHTEAEEDQSVNKECLVDWGDRGFQSPQFVHFFFNLSDKGMQERAEKIMASVQYDPVKQEVSEIPVPESSENLTETPEMKRQLEADLQESVRRYDFYDAVKELDYSKMEKFIKEGFDLNSSRNLGEPILNSAIEFAVRSPESGDYFPVVKFLVEHGANVDPPARKHIRKPLGVASYIGNKSMVKYLIQKGADIEASDGNGETPILLAAEGHPNSPENDSVVEYLLKKGANIEVHDEYGRTPLFWAVYKGYPKIASLLVKHGANINAVDKTNQTLFQIFSEQNRLMTERELDILKLLLENGLDINAHPETRKIFLEKLKPYLEVHSLFEKYGKKNRQSRSLGDEDGYTGFSCGVGGSSTIPLKTTVKNKDYKGVKKLLEGGADVNEIADHRTPLNSAVFQEDQKMVDLLLMFGADINRVDKDCPNTPLHDATYRGYFSLVEHLIKKGSKTNIRNYLGEIPLHLASKMGHYQTTKILLEANPTLVNLKGPDGDTALHKVLSKFTENPKKRIPLIKLLLENGDSPHLKNKAGKSPWDLTQVYPKINHLVLSHSKNP
jgi:ankyrin repeat protein